MVSSQISLRKQFFLEKNHVFLIGKNVFSSKKCGFSLKKHSSPRKNAFFLGKLWFFLEKMHFFLGKKSSFFLEITVFPWKNHKQWRALRGDTFRMPSSVQPPKLLGIHLSQFISGHFPCSVWVFLLFIKSQVTKK